MYNHVPLTKLAIRETHNAEIFIPAKKKKSILIRMLFDGDEPHSLEWITA